MRAVTTDSVATWRGAHLTRNTTIALPGASQRGIANSALVVGRQWKCVHVGLRSDSLKLYVLSCQFTTSTFFIQTNTTPTKLIV